MRCLALAFALAGGAAAGSAPNVPNVPQEYSAVIQMRMPYIPLAVPLRVLTSSSAQKIEFYDGLEVDVQSPNGTFKYSFNNSRRVCTFTPPSAGPTRGKAEKLGLAAEWAASPFLPDLSQYTHVGDELVGGIMCQKFTLDAHHGSLGTMDDHISFFWDAVLNKPVRWHMHARHVTFGSHTDEYIMDFLSFQPGAPSAADLRLPTECEQPQRAEVSIQIDHFLGHAARAAPAAHFDKFLQQHSKAFGAEEHTFRKSVFEQNLLLLKELNRQHAGRATFRANRFMDMTKAEVMRFRGGRNRGSSRTGRRTPEQWQYVNTHEQLSAAPLPASFDWRVARPGSVSPVKDQAMCGSCWAYGLTEPIESIQAIRTGQLVELPEQFVVDCLWTATNKAGFSNSGCDGGNSDIGALEIVRKFGGVIPKATSYGSYLSVNGFCKDVRLMEVGAKLTGWVDIKKRDEQGLLQALVAQGPISVGIQVPDEMLFYDSGVLNVTTCKYDQDQIDHAVVLTGFGRDEHGADYYVIRNSWSTYWGDQGYIKIARGDNDCCIACEAGYPQLQAAAGAEVVV